MPSNTPLTDAINALTQYANETTGASDTTLSDAVGTLVAGYGGGGGFSVDGFATGAEPSGAVVLNTATSIGIYGFACKRQMTSLSAPECLTINDHGLFSCHGLASVSFPKLSSFTSTYQFDDCRSLTVVAFPSLSAQTAGRLFNNCSSLATVDYGNCTQISNQTHNGTGALRTLILRRTADVVYLQAWNAITMGGIYNNPAQSTIYVPSALVSSYQTTGNWASAYAAGVTFTAIEDSQYKNYYADGTPIE